MRKLLLAGIWVALATGCHTGEPSSEELIASHSTRFSIARTLPESTLRNCRDADQLTEELRRALGQSELADDEGHPITILDFEVGDDTIWTAHLEVEFADGVRHVFAETSR